LTVSASFGLAGCAAIDDLKVSISQSFNTGNLTGEGEVPYVKAPEATRVIPPENIPKQAAKTLSTLVEIIDAQRQQGNLSSALRLFVLEFYRSQIPEVEGHEGSRELMEHREAVLA
jgi:hypothetical protein